MHRRAQAILVIVICKIFFPSALIIGADDATSTRYMVAVVKSWYHDVWTPPAPRDYSSRRNYSVWDRRDTRGASSSAYEDKRAGWCNSSDRGNDHATEVGADKNKDKDDGSRTVKEKEAEKRQEKEKVKVNEKEGEKESEVQKVKQETGPGKISSMSQKKKICWHCRVFSTAGKAT